MNQRTRTYSLLTAAVAALALLPLRSDGDQTQCCTVATSLASSIGQPVAGDEDFFTLPTGPAAVMLLLDNSGSMTDFPQCPSGNTSSECAYPSLSKASTNPTSSGTATVSGTCTPSGTTGMAKWIGTVTPKSTTNEAASYADPGFSGGTGGVNDSPPWTHPNCTGDNCMFLPTAYYKNDGWTETSAAQYPSPCTVTFSGTTYTLPGCQECLDGNGFYFLNSYVTRSGTTNTCRCANGNTCGNNNCSTILWFKGTWLNANPPKFVQARRAVKSLLQIANTGALTTRDLIRYGLATFANTNASGTLVDNSNTQTDHMRLTTDTTGGGAATADGARLVVPLGPNCDQASPASPNVSAIVASRNAIISAVNSTTRPIRFANNTPLAEALFNIGQYFSDAGNAGAFATRFPKASSSTTYPWAKQSTTDPGENFWETSAGTVGATVATWTASGRQASICWACQQSAVVIVTDGMPNNENNLPISPTPSTSHSAQPSWDFRNWTPADYRSACGGNRGASGDGCNSYLPLVASYLHNQDQRLADSASSGLQTVSTHAVSFGITDTQALRVLQATSSAAIGGGTFTNSTDYATLIAGLNKAVNAVVQRATSFSATAANSLQTSQTSATETFLARFRPTTGKQYEGHLYQAVLFDEFANGCSTAVGPTDQPKVACGNTTVYPNFDGNVDANGHNICSGAFLVDLDCDEISEDSLGAFIKKKTAGDPTPTAANLVWDAGKVLSTPTATGYRSAAETDGGGVKARNIFTWVNGTKTAFTTANLSTLQPLMGLDDTTCTAFLGSIGFTPASMTASARLTACAQQIIYYVRGYDVFDQNGNGCSAPGNPMNSSTTCANGEQRDYVASDPEAKRMWKLGDIFHSSPAVVKAPIDEVRCDIGFEGQCLPVIHSPASLKDQTPIERYTVNGISVDAYEAWRQASLGTLTNRSRKRVVLAGANDGMLHAFDAGDALPASASPTDPNPDIFGAYAYSSGTGEEVWAFIPPDLLPRLKNLVTMGYHQYMVDGPIMVRDIWVDANGDGTKQKTEFHTLAVVSERAGGSQFTGLNLDDPLNPTMLWNFPPPCDEDGRFMGESWTDFAPRPPPIGPVRLAKSTDPRGFEERWIVALNGGYDPLMVKGRAVFLIDAWTGRRLWRFTDDDFKANVAPKNDPSVSMFPVPGGVALLDVGDPRMSLRDVDGYFDTATWGDMGGQLWVARFHTPGVLDTSSHVTNWTAARAFEQQRRTNDDQWITAAGASTPPNETRGSFFFMTSNVFEPTTRTVRSFAGTGSREAMLVQDVSCGPNNVLGCCQAGCSSVQTSTTDTWGSCTSTQTFTCAGGKISHTSSFTTCSPTATCSPSTATSGTSTSPSAITSTSTFQATCGTYTGPTVTARIQCNEFGVCSSYTPFGQNQNVARSFLADPKTHNRFYGVWTFGGVSGKMFDLYTDRPNAATVLTQAKAFDTNRFTDVSYAGSCAGPTGTSGTCQVKDVTQAVGQYDVNDPTAAVTARCLDGSSKCWAAPSDAGWYYEYGRICPTETCSTSPPWEDEKTSSGGTIVFGCSIWTGFRPIGSAGGVNPCDNSLGTPSFYQYGANAVTGVPTRSCGYDPGEGLIYRAAAPLRTFAPPTEPKIRVAVNKKGEVSYSALDVGSPGTAPSNRQVKTRKELAEPIYWLEVPRDLHTCRHTDPTSCK